LRQISADKRERAPRKETEKEKQYTLRDVGFWMVVAPPEDKTQAFLQQD